MISDKIKMSCYEAARFYFTKSVADVSKKCNCTCALNSNGYLTLMLGAGSGNSAGEYLGTFADAFSES